MRVMCAVVLLGTAAFGREFNGLYEGANLNRIAFPIGGMGTGMYCLEGYGAISTMSVRHKMEFFNEPTCFAAVCVLGDKPEQNIARVIEGPIPDWKYFGQAETGNGATGRTYGFPRFRECLRANLQDCDCSNRNKQEDVLDNPQLNYLLKVQCAYCQQQLSI